MLLRILVDRGNTVTFHDLEERIEGKIKEEPKEAMEMEEKMEKKFGFAVRAATGISVIAVALMLAFCTMMVSGCGRDPQPVQYVQAPVQTYVQPVVQPVVYEDHHMRASDAALVASSVIAGAVVADYLINGHPRPGYLIMDGHVYRDSPRVRNVYSHTTVIKKTTVINNAPQAPKAPTSPVTAPTPPAAKPAQAMTYPTPKVKNPGDAAAEAEKAKMAAEAQRKTELKARLEAAKAGRQQSNTGGFNKFSNKASASSTARSSSSPSGKRK